MQFFYDLSSLGNFYNFSTETIVLTLFGRFMHFVYFMQSLFLSADENSNIDIGAI